MLIANSTNGRTRNGFNRGWNNGGHRRLLNEQRRKPRPNAGACRGIPAHRRAACVPVDFLSPPTLFWFDNGALQARAVRTRLGL